MKKMFSVSTKTIVATGIGAALFTLLFMFVKVPTGIPEVSLQTAYAVGGFFAALFGPIAGGLIAFIGHLLCSVWFTMDELGYRFWSCLLYHRIMPCKA